MQLSLATLTIAILSAGAAQAAPVGNAAVSGTNVHANTGSLHARATAPEGWLASKARTLLPRGSSRWDLSSWSWMDYAAKHKNNNRST